MSRDIIRHHSIKDWFILPAGAEQGMWVILEDPRASITMIMM